jgi:hypothetical protein
MSCPYKHLLGIPEQGVHAKRFLGMAFNDTIMTVIAAAIIAFFTGYSFLWTFIVLWIVAEILHILFGVQTAFLTMIGIKACPS